MGAYKDMKYGLVNYDKNSTFLENDNFTQGKERELEFSNIEIYLVFLEKLRINRIFLIIMVSVYIWLIQLINWIFKKCFFPFFLFLLLKL